MKTLLLLALFISNAFGANISTKAFQLVFNFDSTHIGEELSVEFKAQNGSSPTYVFGTTFLDSVNFEVQRESATLLFTLTDPRQETVSLPFQILGATEVFVSTSLFGQDLSPDLYLKDQYETFFVSLSVGDFLVKTPFESFNFSGEFQNFSGETGKFKIEISGVTIPEPKTVTLLLFFLFLLKRKTPT